MKLKPTKAARLTMDNGQTVILEYLGAGMFHTCYQDANNMVYSVTKDRKTDGAEDYSKEILSHPTLGCDANLHIPPVESLGELEDSERRVYRMPLYQKLRAANKDAWALLKRLQQAREDAWKGVLAKTGNAGWNNNPTMRVQDIGHMVNVRVCELMDAPIVPQSLRDALKTLTDAAANYGASYVFEFSPRNCMVDDSGNLILLDVLFSIEAMEAIRNAQVKRAQVRY